MNLCYYIITSSLKIKTLFKGAKKMYTQELSQAVDLLDATVKFRLLDYLKKLDIDNIFEFYKALGRLDEEARLVFISRWGLDQKGFCQGFNSLDKKLNMKNSKVIYLIAERKLQEYKFTKFFNGDFDYFLMIKLGRLIKDIFSDTINLRSLYGKIDLNALQNMIASLPEGHRSIISMYTSNFSTKEISNTLAISPETVQMKLDYSFRNIRRELEKSIKKESA